MSKYVKPPLTALAEAAQSLQTIADLAGIETNMYGSDQVRAYAASRALVAREALKAAAHAPVLPPGWRAKRNADGSIGLFAPAPQPDESPRTSECFTAERGHDINDIVFKLLTHALSGRGTPRVAEAEATLADRIKSEVAHCAYLAEIHHVDACMQARRRINALLDQLAARATRVEAVLLNPVPEGECVDDATASDAVPTSHGRGSDA